MQEVKLAVKARSEKGKEIVKKLRRRGIIPGVVYGPEEKPMPVAIEAKVFDNLLRSGIGENAIIDLSVANGGKTTQKVLIREVQLHPVTGQILHIDFQHISLTRKITVNIPVHVVGLAVGVKDTGGILQHTLRELTVSCLPTEIPEKVDVDVTALKIGDSIHVRDIKLEKVEVLNDPDSSVVSVVPPTIIKEEELAAAAPAAEVTEPEVITEKEAQERAAAKAEVEKAEGKAEKKGAEAKAEKKGPEAKAEKSVRPVGKEEKKPEKK